MNEVSAFFLVLLFLNSQATIKEQQVKNLTMLKKESNYMWDYKRARNNFVIIIHFWETAHLPLL